MKKLTTLSVLILCLLGALTLAYQGKPTSKQKSDEPDQKDPLTSSVKAFVEGYVKAFNTKDVKTLAASWTEKCVHVDEELGRRTEGRKGIRKDMEALFKEKSKSRLIVQVDRIRAITDKVVQVSGHTSLITPSTPTRASTYKAILVKREGQWKFSSVEERTIAPPANAADALSELDWLIGTWVDDSDKVKVDTTFRWSVNGTFLLRSYVVESKEGVLSTGTQVIGWDPRSREIRSWSFDSDGSFGDGIWSKNGNDWLVRSSRTLADGRAASGTFVMTKIDESTMTVQLIGHEIEGELMATQPPVKVVRAPEPKKTDTEKPETKKSQGK